MARRSTCISARAPSASNPFPCQEQHDDSHSLNPDLSDNLIGSLRGAFRDEFGGDGWEDYEAFVSEQYIECLEGAVQPYYDDFGH